MEYKYPLIIPFNKTHLTGNETAYVNDVLQGGKISGGGKYAKACEVFFENKYSFLKTCLTTSCTHALEMAALLIGIKPGDEVIMPSFTFVSSANPFVLRGATIVFADSGHTSPNIDEGTVEALITTKTKAILAIHYAGSPCKIDTLRTIADRYNLFLIEDAAQALDGFYKGKPLGSFGHLATFSFHDTKNITCGEGGLLVINDKRFVDQAEIIREKGTNWLSFARGEVSKYTWVDVGSSYMPSELLAAVLLAQLQNLDNIQQKRLLIWQQYYNGLQQLHSKNQLTLPYISTELKHNAHTFYFVCPSADSRKRYINFMAQCGVQVQFHYIPLHDSPFYNKKHGNRELPMACHYKNCLVRLPLFYDITSEQVEKVIELTRQFFGALN